MASENVAVIVTVSEAASRLSASVSDKITDTLELHTPHSGRFAVVRAEFKLKSALF